MPNSFLSPEAAAVEARGLLRDEDNVDGAPQTSPTLEDRLCANPILTIIGACILAFAVTAIGVSIKHATETSDTRGLRQGAPVTSTSPATMLTTAMAMDLVETTTLPATTTTLPTTTTVTTTPPSRSAMQRRLFQVITNPDKKVSLRASNGAYLSVSEEGKLGNAAAIGKKEMFRFVEHSDGTVSLKGWNGEFLAAKGDHVKMSNDKGKAEKLKKIENGDGTIMLQTFDGGYVSNGAISEDAGRFAIYARETEKPGDAEKFEVQENEDGTVCFKTLHGTYITAESSGSVVAWSTKIGAEEKFKRHHDKDGTVSVTTTHGARYLTAFENGTMIANMTKLGELEKFSLVKHGDGTMSLKASSGKYLSVSKLPILTFYMYRAQGNNDYPWMSVNTGNLGGVLWYLHNEVVVETPRKFGISRIVRMKFQTTSTEAMSAKGLNFGVRFAYDTGMCTGAGPINGYASCRSFYEKLGYFIGCNYLGDYPFPMASKGFPSYYEGGLWYSLPKEGACLSAPNGLDECTYFAEEAGSIDIGDMYDMGDQYWDWYNNPDSKEYVADTDEGVGCDFWNKKEDADANRKRVERALKLFQEKYPDVPSEDDYPDPVCDFNCKKFYTSEEMDEVGEECQCSEFEEARQFFPELDVKECKLDALSGLKGVGYYDSKDQENS